MSVLHGSIGAATINSGDTLDGVTVIGMLNVSFISARNGFKVLASNGSQPGSIDLTGSGSTLSLLDSETLDNVGITFGTWTSTLYPALSDTGTLTLGSHATLDVVGQGVLTADTLVNDGVIRIEAGGTLTIQPTIFDNKGTINVTGSAELDVLVAIAGAGGVINVDTGATAKFHSTITGGTINDDAGGAVLSGVRLSGITFHGTLDIHGETSIADGITFAGTSGTGQAEIDIGSSSALLIDDTQTIDNVIINLGHGFAGAITDVDTAAVGGQTLTLGASVVVNASGWINPTSSYNYNYIGYDPFETGAKAETIVNLGTINATAGTLTIQPTIFDNKGLLNAHGGVLIVNPDSYTELSSNTLSAGGTLEASASGALDIEVGHILTVDDAIIILSGAGSSLISAGQSLESTLASVTGTLSLQGARGWTGLSALTDSGLIQLAGGDFATPGLTLAQSGRLMGFGSLTGPIANSGTIAATGGTLTLATAPTGAGLLRIDAGARLELATSSADGVTFNGTNAVLQLDAPGSYTGTIAGIAASDTIVLKGQLSQVTGAAPQPATISGTTLSVTLTNGTTEHFTLAAPAPTLHVGVTLDGAGNTDLVFFHAAAASAVSPNPIAFGDHHVGDVVTQVLSVTNTAPADGYSELLDSSGPGDIPGVAIGSNVIVLLGPQQTSTSDALTLVTTSAGFLSGNSVMGFGSDPTFTSGNGGGRLPSQTIAVTGTVYAYASPVLTSGTVDFGVVHVGDVVHQAVTLTNDAAANGFSEGLDALASAASAGFTLSGTIIQLAAGASSTAIGATMVTTAAGTLTGSATLSAVSDGTGIDSLGTTALAPLTVALRGTVDNFAAVSFSKLGGTGALSHTGNTWTLDLGSSQNGGSVNLGVLNAATGLADLLGGSFTVTGSSAFTNTGLAAFSGVAAGSLDSAPSIALHSAAAGTYSETITLHSAGANSSGFQGALADQTLTVVGTITLPTAITSVSGGTSTATGFVTQSRNLTIAGTALAGDTVVLTLSGSGTIGSTTADTTGHWSFDDSATTLDLGSYALSATAVTAAGQFDATTTDTLVIGSVPTGGTPQATPTIIAEPSDSHPTATGYVTSSHSIRFLGTAPANDIISISVGGTVVNTTTADASGNWSRPFVSFPVNGTYIVAVTASDGLGGVSAPAATTLVVDDHTPAAPVIFGITPDTGTPGDGITSATGFYLTGTAEPLAKIAVWEIVNGVNFGQIAGTTASATGDWSIGASLTDKSVTLAATQVDAAGTSSALSSNFVITNDTHTPAAPIITGITPDSGVSSSDGVTQANAITVAGTGEANDTVTISTGALTATGTVTAAGSFAVALPALGDGAYSLTATVTDAAGTSSAASQAFGVTIDSAAATLATPLATPGGDYFIGNAAALLAASRPIAAPAGLFNTLVIQGDGTLTDAGFAGISNVKGLTLNGTGSESLTLGANASAMTGGFIAVSVPNAASYTIDDGGAGAPPLYLLGGSGNATVTGSDGGDYLVFNGGTLHVTDGAKDDYINIAANQLNLAGTTINGGGGYNRLVMAGSNTLTDSSFVGVSNIQELDFSGTGAQSVVLGANAHAAFGANLTIYSTTASTMTIDASGLGATGLTVTGSGADTLIAGTGGAYFTGGAGADLFKVGLGGTSYINDFVPGLDRITLQAGTFTNFAQVTAATTQYGSSGFDIAVGNGAHVVVLGVAFTAMHAGDFGLSS